MPPLPDIDSFTGTFGGPFQNAHPVEDPTTDQDANFANDEMCDVAMMTHTVDRAWVLFNATTYDGSGNQTITVADHDAVWGSGSGVKPTVKQTAAGRYVMTWAATQQDELGNSHTINIRRVHQPVMSGATLGVGQVVSWTANTVTVQAYDSTLAANALNGDKIQVSWS